MSRIPIDTNGHPDARLLNSGRGGLVMPNLGGVLAKPGSLISNNGMNAYVETPTQWTYVAAATPTTPGAVNPASFIYGSETNGSHNSGYKGVIKLSGRRARNGICLKNEYPFGSSGLYSLAAATGDIILYAKPRVRAIVADFDITTLTWNGISGLTFSATEWDRETTAVWGNGASRTSPLDSINNINAGNVTILTTETIYGLLFECMPELVIVGGVGLTVIDVSGVNTPSGSDSKDVIFF